MTDKQQNFDWHILMLKERLDPMLEAVGESHRSRKGERMWLPLFIYYPVKQLVSLFTFGKFGSSFSKLQTSIGGIIAATPLLSRLFESGRKFIEEHTFFQLFLMGLAVWYIFTLIYTFLQMPNWKNKDLFHIDAYRIFRPNEYAVVDPFLDKEFSVGSINNWILRNSNERTITELKKNSEELAKTYEELLEKRERDLDSYEDNFKFLNNFLINVSSNILKIGEEKLGPEHLYLIDAPYCVHEVKDDTFQTIYQCVPRKTIKPTFPVNDVDYQDEIFVKCYCSNMDEFYEDEDEFSYKVSFEDNTHWIVSFYPELGDDRSLQALMGYSIIGNTEQVDNVLETASLKELIQVFCSIINGKKLVSTERGALNAIN